MDDPLDPVAISKLVEDELESLHGDEKRAYDNVMTDVVVPAFHRGGLSALGQLRFSKFPHVRDLMIKFCSREGLDTLEFVSREDLLDAAIEDLARYPYDPLKANYGYGALVWGTLRDDDRYSLVVQLVDLAPWDDLALWMIGDMLIGILELPPGGRERVLEECQRNPKFAHCEQLRRRPGW